VAYFEQHLLDYDAAINWGNWQYLAGVGVDQYGKRHFDLGKYTPAIRSGRNLH
jgi:deoxyribodipyrimidine photo-lyase